VASNTKSAIVPSVPPSNAVSIDRTVNGASSPVDLASAISSAMADMRGVLINMTPDDVTTPIVPKSVLRLGFVFARTVAPMAQQLDHQAAMLLVARARKKAQAERLAAIEELEFWFRKDNSAKRWPRTAGNCGKQGPSWIAGSESRMPMTSNAMKAHGYNDDSRPP
jgi:hypothetical protein